VIINTAASVDHDGHIGAHAHTGPGCHLAGNVSVGQGTQSGVGVMAIPGVTIGEWSIIGAGAVVTRDIPANVTAVGAPARVIKGREPDAQR
jgi:acetyltransferase-like isoleucine patch superfamily enzyme